MVGELPLLHCCQPLVLLAVQMGVCLETEDLSSLVLAAARELWKGTSSYRLSADGRFVGLLD